MADIVGNTEKKLKFYPICEKCKVNFEFEDNSLGCWQTACPSGVKCVLCSSNQRYFKSGEREICFNIRQIAADKRMMI